MARVLTRVLGLLCLAGVAACAGETEEVDSESLAAAIPGALVPEAPEVVADVVCPPEIERGVGVVVACTASVAGTPVLATVEQVDDDGRIVVDTDTVMLDKVDVAAELADRLQADLGILVGADCDPPRVIVPAAGAEFACTASDEAGRPLALMVRLLDAAGAYEVRPAG